jgi:hypothetical protein
MAAAGPALLETNGPGALAHPSRFPSQGSGSPRAGRRATPISELPALPPLEGDDPRRALRVEVDLLYSLGRQMGLDLGAAESRIRSAVAADDLLGFDSVRRELFVQEAAALAERLEGALARGQELRALLGTETPDAELDGAREALGRGNLLGSFRVLRIAEEGLDTLEEEWETVRVLALEAELLVETIRELGGDPSPAQGPLEAARKYARAGDRAAAEPLLARALLALWHVVAPLLRGQVVDLTARLEGMERSGESTLPARHALHAMAGELRAHNFGGAVVAWRRARDAAGGLRGEPKPALPAR